MELVECPECGAAAEITWRFAQPGTDGPVEHVRLQCVRRHWFLGPVSSLLVGRAARAVPPSAALPAATKNRGSYRLRTHPAVP